MRYLILRPGWPDCATIGGFSATALVAVWQLPFWFAAALALASASIVASRLLALRRERQVFRVACGLLGADPTSVRAVSGVLPPARYLPGLGTTLSRSCGGRGGSR